MPDSLRRPRGRKAARGRAPAAWRPFLEWLEERTLPSGSPLPFTPFGTAHAAGFLAAPDQFDLYRVRLDAGDRIDVQTSGGLPALLRVFDAGGNPLALDDQEGGDARLNFQ